MRLIIKRIVVRVTEREIEHILHRHFQEVRPHVRAIKLIFTGLSLQGVDPKAGELTKNQFQRFVKEIGVLPVEAPSEMQKAAGAKLISFGEAGLIFQRSNVMSMRSRSLPAGRDGTENTIDIEIDGVDALIESDGDDDRADFMMLHEFVASLIRLAWVCYPKRQGIGERLTSLLCRAVLPVMQHIIHFVDPMEEILRSKRVQIITAHYIDELRKAFLWYAKKDQSVVGSSGQGLQMVSYSELILMLKEGKLLSERLTLTQVGILFNRVNVQASEAGEDDDTQQLNFNEFVGLGARLCDAMIPESLRGGEPFEHTWQAWLHTKFVPVFRRVRAGKT